MKLLNNIKQIPGWFLKLPAVKKVLVLIAIVLVGGFIYISLTKKSNKPSYQTATVEKGTLVTSVTASGTVTSGNSTPITTQATGVVSEVYVKNGDYVNQGQNVATIALDQSSQQKQAAAYSSYLSAVNNLNQAKSQINGLQAALFQANQAFVTDRGVANPITDDPQYIIEKANWLQAESNYNNQQNVINQAQAALNSASLSLAQTSATVTAPISGTISNLNLTPGLPIISSSTTGSGSNSSSNSTASTQTLGNVTLDNVPLTATVDLTEIDVTKIKVGQKVTITLDAFPDKTFTGKVVAIDTTGSVSSGVTTYPTTITFDSSIDGIYPNMGVNVTIITSVTSDALIVPSAAVQTVDGSSTVRILKNGQIQTVDVEIGKSSDTQTQITSGLSNGDTVVTGTISTQRNTTTGGSSSPFGGGNASFGGARVGGFGGGAGRTQVVNRQRGG
ncbi:MAG TPA: HlyD family efflux transporter periplasmic adaptor subunit [Patescibacteria group bacterium]|nr:HlyD family efflux transporter periplasmic adaptor subunit [Patescibacteria group bacterium]